MSNVIGGTAFEVRRGNRGEDAPSAAPIVLQRLSVCCAGDEQAIGQILDCLDSGQRRGLRALPDPLPLVPAIAAHAARLRLGTIDRRVLLAAALNGDGGTDVLLPIAGSSVEALASSPAAAALELSAGRYRMDPRIRIWIYRSTDAAGRAESHKALATIHAGRDAADALWHRARGTLDRDDALAEPLLACATARNAAGDAQAAQRLADEAASHADAATRPRAELVAGLAALSAGHLDDAVERLESAAHSPRPQERSEALSALLVAATARRGRLPPSAAPRPGVVGFARAAGLAAVLCAERGAVRESRAWLSRARLSEAAGEQEEPLAGAFAACCAVFTGDRGHWVETRCQGPSVATALALDAAIAGDVGGGLEALAEPVGTAGSSDDPVLRGIGAGPLARAQKTVAEALLRTWAGDLSTAHGILVAAAGSLPLAVPYAGLAVVLLRRLELAMDGRCGPVSEALALSLPESGNDRLVEHAIEAHLAGRPEEAVVRMQLWVDRGAQEPVLGVPGLDEVGPIRTTGSQLPPDLERARELRRRIRFFPAMAAERESAETAAASRGVASPFERGRVEALLGTALLARGSQGDGRRHLGLALGLFGEAGAHAWRRAVERRLDGGRAGRPGAEEPAREPLTVCRALWEPVLTPRELEVVMLLAEGRTNREISDSLHLSVRTVEVYVGRVLTRFGVRTRGELIALAYRTDHYG